jgi:hypothetical protein
MPMTHRMAWSVTQNSVVRDTCSRVSALKDHLVPESVVYSDYLTGRSMPDFVGVNGLEKNLVDAIMNFSYYLTLGDLDAAFKAIKTVKK